VQRLNGIFAFAVWDREDRRLFLARDHLGIKPLYYAETPAGLVFASEAKAIFASKLLSPSLNAAAVPEYLVFRDVAGDRTLFQDVQRLPPGHCAEYRNGRLTVEAYWNPVDALEAPQRSRTEGKAETRALLSDAVRGQLMSDVPLGTFCSGGVDSSLVTALAALEMNEPVNTFSVGFDDPTYDETRYARMVADRYGTHHHELRLDEREYVDLLPRLTWHNDEPLNFANSVHIYAISALAGQHVTVVLTGEGADELFGGYPRYAIARLQHTLGRLPAWLRGGMGQVLCRLPERRLRKLGLAMNERRSMPVFFNPAPVARDYLYDTSFEFLAEHAPYRYECYRRAGAYSGLLAAALMDQQTYLVSILNRQDKMSMAASIESRVPILDYRLVELANRLPDRVKQSGMSTKRLLKEIAGEYLPEHLIHRRKSGFGVPLPEWLAGDGPLSELTRSLIAGGCSSGIAQALDAPALLQAHQQGNADHSEFLWSVMNLELWLREYGVSS
jgi:asparagine synthase (glutamine-hydrolysing)